MNVLLTLTDPRQSGGMGEMRVAKLRVGILRVEVWASTRLVSYFKITRSLPDANAIAHNRNFHTGNKTCILAHITRLYAMYATITLVINIKKEPVHHLLYETVNLM